MFLSLLLLNKDSLTSKKLQPTRIHKYIFSILKDVFQNFNSAQFVTNLISTLLIAHFLAQKTTSNGVFHAENIFFGETKMTL